MHDSSAMRLSRRHRITRNNGEQLLGDDAVSDNESVPKLSKRSSWRKGKRSNAAIASSSSSSSASSSSILLAKRQDDEQKEDEALVLKIHDANAQNNNERLATAPLATKGAANLPPITLGSYVSAMSAMSTPLLPASGPATPSVITPGQNPGSSSSSSFNKAPQQGRPGGKLQQDDIVWPIAVGVMFVVFVLVYALSISRSLIHAVSSGILTRGWSLRASPPAISLHKSSYPLPVRQIGKMRARSRGFYNRYLLPTIPWINLTIGQCLVLVGYLACIVVALFIQTGGPIQDVIRSGRIAVAQYPFLFALATKNNLLGITGKSYEKLNFLHRFAGRSTLITGLVHSAVYLQKLSGDGSLDIPSTSVQWTGLMAMVVSIFIMITSFQFVRNLAYQVFMISHILGWVALLVSSYMHVEYARPWVWASVAIMAVDFAVRLCKLRLKTATVHTQEGGIVRVEFDDIKSGWRGGQHVWIRRLDAKSIFEVHPFSIANSAEYAPLVRYHLNEAQDREGLVLYSKACGKWTRDLYQTASKNDIAIKSANPFADDKAVADGGGGEKRTPTSPSSQEEGNGEKVRLLVDGPYGINLSAHSDFETVVLVAGGSGITFILNALEEIVARSIQVLSTTKRVKLIFAIRSTSQFDSFLFTIRDILSSTRRACPYLEIQVEIYETRTVVTSPLSPPLSAGTPRTGGTYIASTPRTGALSATTPRAFLPQKNEYICQGIRIIRGKRPNLVACLNHSLNDTIPQSQGKKEMGGGVALVTCGPVGLIDDARKAAKDVDQDLAYKAGGIVVHSERFNGDDESGSDDDERERAEKGGSLVQILSIHCI